MNFKSFIDLKKLLWIVKIYIYCWKAMHPSRRNVESWTKTLEKLLKGDLKMVQCRICHEEDLDSNMESPCSCSGSLKVKT